MPESEPSNFLHPPEPISSAPFLGDAVLSGETQLTRPFAESKDPLPITISGHDRGYIRTSPDAVRSLLAASFEDAYVIPDHEPRAVKAVERAIDLSTRFGVVTVGSQRQARGIVEEYEAITRVDSGNGFDSLVIRAEGPLHASQLSRRAEQIKIPMVNILPQPKVDITFTQRGEDEQIITHRFVFAREGMTSFERSIDDKDGYRVEALDRDAALNYLEEHLPVVEDNAGQPILSQGSAQIPDRIFDTHFNDIRLNRLGSDSLQAAAKAKLDAYGYDMVLYVPEGYFKGNSRDGEFFSVDVPEALIPADILKYPDPMSRVKKIIGQIETDVDQSVIDDVLYLAKGLPGGRSRVALLMQGEHDTVPRPQLKAVPTNVYDKSLAYLLQHPDVVAETMTAYREVTDILGKPFSETNIQIALETGLLNRDQTEAREMFGGFSSRFDVEAGKAAAAQAALDKAFAALVGLGAKLKSVYSEEEITHYAQNGNALLVAGTST